MPAIRAGSSCPWPTAKPTAADSARPASWLVSSVLPVLTGQDGLSPDQARGFAPTPQELAFGVCATASSDPHPHCTADPATVPKAMDVFTPPGVAQADELDYTVHHPVTLQAVTM